MIEYGNFATIEGSDGSGKATQTEITHTWIVEELGKTVLKLSFPRYGEPSAVYVEKYLNADYGQADDVPADLGALPFIIDRVAAKPIIERHLHLPNSFALSDRYVASNLAHQGTKISDEKTRHEFYERTMRTEYEVLEIPKPRINIVLLVSTSTAQLNVDKKDVRSYTDKKRDIHEANASHLDRAKANYEELCRLYPDEFTPIQCMDEDGNMRLPEDIQSEIRRILVDII